ncbi:hypothetical protein FIBSPDRAFT_860331 [Athelia psychrophila]|uniref:SH3 domain-containing protein n=1 Tax=Athelia psychrophila TaxID=1759441 RepID=A0A166KAU0_9AGAM|nr:hypothetical protein FIBSPDRAFT_860331 [Fibularhizoctonia sp. CBS 109695]
MVFANLGSHEKDAFFGLLDEYFQSRPDLLPAIAGSSGSSGHAAGSPGGEAANAVGRALASNPQVTSQLFSAGLKHGVPKNSPYGAIAHNPELNSVASRFGASAMTSSYAGAKGPPPAPPPRKTTADTQESSPVPVNRVGLANVKKFGDVDTSSAKNMFTSLRGSTAAKTAPPPPINLPPTFETRKGAFAPPPVRRGPAAVPTPPQPEPEEEEEQAQGEWAESMYEFSSTEPGDLPLAANQRLLITERTSEDWWTGEADGRSGLFPASYVKLL